MKRLNSNEKEYEKLINLINARVEKFKRFICAKHGYDSRTSAFLYIDGEIMMGDNHPDMISDYLAQKKEYGKGIIKQYCDSHGFDEEKTTNVLNEFERTGELPSAIYRDFTEWDRGNNRIKNLQDIALAFGHVEDHEGAIYLETNSLVNVDVRTVALAIKSEYPGYDVYDDDSKTEDGYKKIAKIAEIKPVEPINPTIPTNNKGYNGYNSYTKQRQNNPQQQKSKQQYQDTFERTTDDPECLYDSDGKFVPTRIGQIMSRLRKVADSAADSLRSDRAKQDIGGYMVIDAPPYATSDNSYMGYVNQNPDNIYYKRLIKKDPSVKRPEIYTTQDFVNEYFEDDEFTLKRTK